MYMLNADAGPVIRISPTFLTVSDAHLVPLVYHRDADKTPHDAPMVTGAPDSLFTVSDHKAHARARRMIGRPYTPSAVARLEPLIDEHVTAWVSRLTELYATSSSGSFDLAPWCSYLSFDVISSLAFGAPLGFIAAAGDVSNLIYGLHTGWLVFGILQRLHPLRTWLTSTRLFRRLFIPKPNKGGSKGGASSKPASRKSEPSGFGHLLAERDRLLDARLAAIEAAGGSWCGRADMLAAILDARDDSGKPLPLDVVRMEVMSILVAGADTTGTTLQSFLVELLRRPAALARCTAEARAAFSNRARLPAAPEVHAACPYLCACLRETMRLSPAAPNFMPRLVSSPGLVLPCGPAGNRQALAPPGTEISANIWIVGRDAAVYGDDADTWRPERWLVEKDGRIEIDDARVREWARFSLTWGAGARTCLGQSIAWMELVKAGTEILRAFDLERAHGAEKWVVKGGVGWWEDVQVKLVAA